MASEQTDYIVASPIRHNGKRYEPGAYISLTDAEAAPLLAAGAVADVDAGMSQDKPAAKLNVNTASAAEIAKAAKGIGKKTATDLVKHREANGPFRKLKDITAVGGISGATVLENQHVLTV